MNRPSVLVIDAGLGNIGSVVAALQRHDCSAQRLQRPPTPEATYAFSRRPPGVGAFASGMEALKASVGKLGSNEHGAVLGAPAGHLFGYAASRCEGVEAPLLTVLLVDLIPGRVHRQRGFRSVLPHVGWLDCTGTLWLAPGRRVA